MLSHDDGYADLSRFTTFDVAELRVSKGFSSVVLGPNALGGAVNVVSRRPTGRLEGLMGLGAASGHSRRAYANAGSRAGLWYAQGGASFAQADTFPLSDDFVAVKNENGGSRENAFREDVKFNVKLGVTANVEYEEGRVTQNESGRLFDVPSFAVVAARATVAVRSGLDPDVTLNNLFDRNYWVADGYPEAGRTVLAGLRWKF